MAIQVHCPQCDAALKVPDELVGKKLRCKACQEVFLARDDSVKPISNEEKEERLQDRSRPRTAAAEPPPVTTRSRSTKRRDDYDEEEDRPVRRTKAERPLRDSSSDSALPLILGGVAVLLFIIGSVTTGLWFVSRFGPSVDNVNDPLVQGGPDGLPGEFQFVPGPQLRYRWQGSPLVYSVNVEFERDSHTEIHEGSCIVRAEKSAQAHNPFAAFEQKGTGTGFVVNPDGIIVTCHHVVNGATKIEVALAGKTYPGEVVALDDVHDLAIVRIKARDLPALTLADSDTAEVGQEIRALGYPLASVLGDNIKATRGTIAGIDRRGGRRSFQIDAAINPGNSGGPLVAENGQVLGVNNSKLSGDVVSNVGFAAPSNEAKRLLQQNRLKFATGGWNVKLEGPELVRRVAAATALITVSMGPDRDADAFRVTCSGSLLKRDRARAGNGIRPPGPPPLPRFPNPSVIEMDASGFITQMSGGTQLPMLLGEMGQFLIEPIDQGNRETWETTGSCVIEESSGAGFGMFGPRLPGAPLAPPGVPGPPGFPGAPGNNTKQMPAVERSRYSRGEAVGHVVPITKRYELKAKPTADGSGLELIGESKIQFDTSGGFPRAVEFKGLLTQTRGNATVKIPISATYRLVEGEQREQILRPAPPQEPGPRQQATEPTPPKPATESDLDALLAELRQRKQWPTVDKIASIQPTNEQREKVVKALLEVLDDADPILKRHLARALGTWAEKNKESGEKLVKLVDDSNLFVRREAVDALAKLLDERGIEPIAKRLADAPLRPQAKAALIAYGSSAEKAVLAVLEDGDPKDWATRMEACKVLNEIGTEESKPALEKAAGEQGLVSLHAKQALEAIGKRK